MLSNKKRPSIHRKKRKGTKGALFSHKTTREYTSNTNKKKGHGARTWILDMVVLADESFENKLKAFAAFSQKKEVPKSEELVNTRRTNPILKKRLEAERKKREEQERLKAEEKKKKEEAAKEREKKEIEELKRKEEARQQEIEKLERELEEMAAIRIQSLVRSALTRMHLIALVDQMTEDLLHPEAAEARKIKEAALAAKTNEKEQKKKKKGFFGKLFGRA